MEWGILATILIALAVFPPTRKLLKVWVGLSLLLVWVLSLLEPDITD